MLAPNSASTCLHAPHGRAGSSRSVTTAHATTSRAPAATAAQIAARSAQMVRP
jgi:hypothetical protein